LEQEEHITVIYSKGNFLISILELNHVEAVMGIEKALQRTHALVRQSFKEETLTIGEPDEDVDGASKLYIYLIPLGLIKL